MSSPIRLTAGLAARRSFSSKESKVPVGHFPRLANFVSLAVKLSTGSAAKSLKNSLKLSNSTKNEDIFDENQVNQIVNTLCHMRGAAVKIGQMISIQGSEIMDNKYAKIFERVRQGANFMPFSQVDQVLKSELGLDWRDKFEYFNEKPLAAASIGQVHLAVSKEDSKEICIKIQYPKIDKSMDNDIDNFLSFLNLTKIVPKGLYAEYLAAEARAELAREVDYEIEAKSLQKMRNLCKKDQFFFVPKLYPNLSTKKVLTVEKVDGKPLDKFSESSKEVKEAIGSNMVRLVLKELFHWNFMQTDPNWSNFFYDEKINRVNLIDFGACRKYDPKYSAMYFKIIESAVKNDWNGTKHWLIKAGFLSGYESVELTSAHVKSVMMLSEPFKSDSPFDFGRQDITQRLQELLKIMLFDRLKPPPSESYSIHRKLSGMFLLLNKIRAKIDCKSLFEKYALERSEYFNDLLSKAKIN